ncbi:MAG: hypothetical protein ACKOPT_02480, partial [Cyanobium sp.]
EPGLATPPFRLSLIALLLCLQFHLIREAEERQIPLKALRGTLTVDCSEQRHGQHGQEENLQAWRPPDIQATLCNSGSRLTTEAGGARRATLRRGTVVIIARSKRCGHPIQVSTMALGLESNSYRKLSFEEATNRLRFCQPRRWSAASPPTDVPA